MTEYYCCRKLYFDTAHRVFDHGSKCRFLHGHRYTLEAVFSAKKLDNLGMVIDFADIDKILGSWLQENWDHNVVLWEKDNKLGNAIAESTEQKIYYLPYNPTAENMAKYLLEEICSELFADSDIFCSKIILHETPNCFVVVMNKR